MFVVKEGCPGCGACKRVCPAGAIVMEQCASLTGARIIAEKCISCGLCAAACAARLIKKEAPDKGSRTKKNMKDKGV